MLQGMVLRSTFLKNWKVYLLLVLLMTVIGVAGYLLGYSASEKDAVTKVNAELQKYIEDNQKLTDKINELNSRQPQVVEKIVIEYRDKVDTIDENTDKAIADVKSGAIGLYGEAIRDAEASAATANLTSATVGAHAARSCRFSNEVSEALLKETGRADRVAVKLESLQKYVLSVHQYVDDYNDATKKFYRDNGWAINDALLISSDELKLIAKK
jgi:hypothetical protein